MTDEEKIEAVTAALVGAVQPLGPFFIYKGDWYKLIVTMEPVDIVQLDANRDGTVVGARWVSGRPVALVFADD